MQNFYSNNHVIFQKSTVTFILIILDCVDCIIQIEKKCAHDNNKYNSTVCIILQ